MYPPLPSYHFFASCLPLHLRTVMHLVVEGEREEIFRVLIEHDNLRLELQDKNGLPPLWYALNSSTDFSDSSYASLLIKKGASPDAVSVGSPSSSYCQCYFCPYLLSLVLHSLYCPLFLMLLSLLSLPFITIASVFFTLLTLIIVVFPFSSFVFLIPCVVHPVLTPIVVVVVSLFLFLCLLLLPCLVHPLLTPVIVSLSLPLFLSHFLLSYFLLLLFCIPIFISSACFFAFSLTN